MELFRKAPVREVKKGTSFVPKVVEGGFHEAIATKRKKAAILATIPAFSLKQYAALKNKKR